METVEYFDDPEDDKNETTLLLNDDDTPDTERYLWNSKLIHQGVTFITWVAGGAATIYCWSEDTITQKALEACTASECAEIADDTHPWKALLPLVPIIILGGHHLVHVASQ